MPTLKTTEEWIKELPPKIQFKVIKNIKYPEILQIKDTSLSKTLESTFNWHTSNEGYDYWCNIWLHIEYFEHKHHYN